MGAMLAKIWKIVQSVLRLILPSTFGKLSRQVRWAPGPLLGGVVKGKEPSGGFGRGLLRVLAFLILIGILVGLYFIGLYTGIGRVIRIDPKYVAFYLPAMALLIYGLVWLGWYFSKLL